MEALSISVKEITDKVLAKELLFLLATRNQDAFNEWRIEGVSIRKKNENMFNTTKEKFLQQVETAASDIKPPNFEQIVVINRGIAR